MTAPSAGRHDEGGFVLAWVALLLTLLLGVAGFAVDLGHWYLTSSRLQNGADAAAMGGVVHLPGDMASASAAARLLAQENGVPDGGATRVEVGPGVRPTQLKVTVRTTVSNFFAGLLGVPTTTISRSSVADFRRPIAMGSPYNTFGNEPTTGSEARWGTGPQMPGFWANIAGPGTDKILGDRYASGRCQGPETQCVGSDNQEFDPSGHLFRVHVDANRGADLQIEAFDPAFVQVGSTCTNHYLNDAEVFGSRYRKGTGNFCTGDHNEGGSGVFTTFRVLGPDATPATLSDNPVACAPQEFAPYNFTGSADTGVIRRLLDPTSSRYDPAFVARFRRWVPVCTVPAGAVRAGDYMVEVRTNAAVGSSPTDRGQNRFALRSGFRASPRPSGTGLQIVGVGRLPIFANITGQTGFDLVRLDTTVAGQTMRLEFFDVGDAGSAPRISLWWPQGASASYSEIWNLRCRWSRGGTPIPNSTGCFLTGASGTGFDGQAVVVEVDVPPS